MCIGRCCWGLSTNPDAWIRSNRTETRTSGTGVRSGGTGVQFGGTVRWYWAGRGPWRRRWVPSLGCATPETAYPSKWPSGLSGRLLRRRVAPSFAARLLHRCVAPRLAARVLHRHASHRLVARVLHRHAPSRRVTGTWLRLVSPRPCLPGRGSGLGDPKWFGKAARPACSKQAGRVNFHVRGRVSNASPP